VTHDDAITLLARLLRPIAPDVDMGALDPAASLTDEADLDSIDFLNLVTALDEETGIEVPERDYPLVRTVDGFASYVVAHAATAHRPGR
jgi:acyl carrier protein